MTIHASFAGEFKEAQGMWASSGGAWVEVPLGSGPGLPSNIPGLGVWLEADSITGLADGASVVTWPDKSGLNRHAVPVTTAPKWRSNISGKPAVEFTGGATSTRLKVPGWGTALSGSTAYTMFVVVRQTTALTSYPIITCAPATAVWQWLTEFNTDGKTYWGHTNTRYRLYASNYVVNQTRLFTNVHGPSPRFYQNGVEVTSYTTGGGGDMTAAVPNVGADVLIGGHYDGGIGLNGYIWAMLWYDRSLTNAEVGKVELYLTTKYGPFGVVATQPADPITEPDGSEPPWGAES